MQRRHIIALGASAVLMVFLFLAGWEFWLEAILDPLGFLPHGPETGGEKLETILLGTGAAGLAVLISAIVSARTIRERAQAENARQRTEARFSDILRIASEAIISTDEEGRIQLFNQGAERIFGYSEAEMVGRPLDLLIPERFRGTHGRHMAAFQATPESNRLMDRRGTIWGLRRDGTEFPAEAAISKLVTDGGVAFNVLLHDITERKRTEDALRANEASLANAQRIASIGSWEWDIASGQVRRSDEMYRLLGLEPGEKNTARDKFLQRIYPDDRAAVDCAARSVLDEGAPFGLQFRIVLPDGTERVLYERGEVTRDAAGRPVRVTGTTQDITEHTRIEDALRESEKTLKERLEQLEVAHRRLEWQGGDLVRLAGDLRIARDEAEAANRAKSEFLALMSHELRTPLNAVIGFSEIIKEETLGPVGSMRYREYADDIHASGQHLLALINDILDLSKVESGADQLHEENISVPTAVDAVMRLIKDRAQRSGVKLTATVDPGIPELRADQRKLKQILINLLSNAVKFTESGGEVALRCWGAADGGVSFQVTDTGIGIAHDHIATVMEPFQQVDSQLNRKYEGTGLGLPLTKALVELHGGALELESEEGAGTTVTVRFPAARAIASPDRRVPPRPGKILAQLG